MSTAVPTPAPTPTATAAQPIAASARAGRTWLAPVTAMTFVLGALIGLALKTQNIVRHDNLPSSRYSGLAEAYLSMKTMLAYQQTIGTLQRSNQQLTADVGARSPRTRALDAQLRQAQLLAGLTPVHGPGIVVTLNDSKRAPADTGPAPLPSQILDQFVIHDRDILNVINELRAGGAEAFSVNDQRVIASTAIRCVGPAIQVNGVPLTPPYRIRAIGDPHTLTTTLDLPGGIVDSYKAFDPAMIAISQSHDLQLPAYNGAMQYRYAQPGLASESAR